MDDHRAGFVGFAVYVAIGVLLLVSGSTTGAILWFVMAGLGVSAILGDWWERR